MNADRMKELWLGIAVVVIAVIGVLVDAAAQDVVAPETARSEDLFVQRSIYCGGVPEARTADGTTIVPDATAHAVAGPVDTEPMSVEDETTDQGPQDVSGNVVSIDRSRRGPITVTGFEGRILGGSSVVYRGQVPGVAAAQCSGAASPRWYFPYGSSQRGFNEWISLHNPFPDEAVVRISLITRRGVRSPSQLADVAVPAAGTTTLRLNDYEVQRGSLGVEVASVRGRVVAWQTIFAQPPDRQQGVAGSLGATRGATEWYFPAGAVGGGVDQSVSILNPSDDEAIVTVSLITDGEAIQPESLFEQAIPRRSSHEFDLREQLAEFEQRNLGSVSVVVRSVNEVGVVAEHAIFYGEGEFSGFTAEVGAPGGARSWWVAPALQSPTRDSLLLLNTTDVEITVDVTLLTPEGDPILGGDLSALSIAPSGRLRVPLEEMTDSGVAAALVEATGDVAVERVAYSRSAGDVATVMGIPLP